MTQIVFEEDFQCDYDVEPTNIYLLIQERDWDGVVYQADTFPCEVKTFVFRKDAKHPQGLKWRVLPIHAAILNGAPTHAVVSKTLHWGDPLCQHVSYSFFTVNVFICFLLAH